MVVRATKCSAPGAKIWKDSPPHKLFSPRFMLKYTHTGLTSEQPRLCIHSLQTHAYMSTVQRCSQKCPGAWLENSQLGTQKERQLCPSCFMGVSLIQYILTSTSYNLLIIDSVITYGLPNSQYLKPP